jgi:hypothetical protein
METGISGREDPRRGRHWLRLAATPSLAVVDRGPAALPDRPRRLRFYLPCCDTWPPWFRGGIWDIRIILRYHHESDTYDTPSTTTTARRPPPERTPPDDAGDPPLATAPLLHLSPPAWGCCSATKRVFTSLCRVSGALNSLYASARSNSLISAIDSPRPLSLVGEYSRRQPIDRNGRSLLSYNIDDANLP